MQSTYRNLLTAYNDDIEKYAKNDTSKNIIRHVMRAATFETGKRIKFVGFGNSNYRSEQIKEAMLMLEKAMLLKLSYATFSAMPPVIPQFKKSPKLFFLDVGLVNFIVALHSNFFGITDLNNVYNGLITEQIVAQELIVFDSFNNNEIFFWTKEKNQSNAEVDFVLSFKHGLIHFEVKSGIFGTLRVYGAYKSLLCYTFMRKLFFRRRYKINK